MLSSTFVEVLVQFCSNTVEVNGLKGDIKAPLRGLLCSRPHLMLRGLFKPRRGRCFKYLPPESNHPPPHRLRAGGGRGAHGQGPLLGGVAGTEQLRRGPDCSPPPPRRPGQSPKGPRPRRSGAEQPRSGGGRRRRRRRRCRARAAPHQVLGGAAAGAGAEFPRAALHRRQREAAPGSLAQPLPESDKNLVSESPDEV
ncbi:uncharacterized protein LOC121073441 isoform X3 [Cygnus olor]|uniref:uncharacterized protein LOC121073441 isoform X3 n=1 Tax=Cygnus olor TaxID=8869 RepID=UPI001ADE89C1|nr:uncharacterized protein LOC121073441 isoform X3 [Cygnus olor]